MRQRIRSALFVFRNYDLLVKQHSLMQRNSLNPHLSDCEQEFHLGYRNGMEMTLGFEDRKTLLDVIERNKERLE